ncbi:MAG TPA: hypothetical protein VIY29_01880 [Ktedonobacteraceae bacterium]
MFPPGTKSLAEASRTSTVRVPPRWLALARGAWIVCALLLLANFVASIPAYYQLMRTVCTLPNQVPCTMPGRASTSGQLTPDNVQALTQLHLSVTTFAAFYVTVDVVLSLLFWGVGLLIFWRKSDEGMGLFVSLLLVLFGSVGIVDNFLGAWAPTQSPLLLQLLLNFINAAQWSLLGVFLLTFPTGRFVPRWSLLLVLLWIISTVGNLDSPVLSAAVLLLLFGSTFFVMVYRYVRVFDAVQRQQTKWFVYAAAIGIFLGVLSTGLPGVVPADSPYQLLFPITALLTLAFIPLGVGFAILRYRLWDIDIIINRTLVYGSLTALLALVYVGLVIGLGALVRLFTGQVSQSPIVIVASTLAIAALFQPLRHRLQRFIDRRFYRSKYDAAKTLEAFSATLRSEVDLSELREQLLNVVQETMQPAHVSLWLRSPERDGKHQTPWRANPPVSSDGK